MMTSLPVSPSEAQLRTREDPLQAKAERSSKIEEDLEDRPGIKTIHIGS